MLRAFNIDINSIHKCLKSRTLEDNFGSKTLVGRNQNILCTSGSFSQPIMISPQPRPYFTIACRYVTGDGDGHTDYLESSIF